MRYQLHRGDSLHVLRTLAPNSVDAIVTDPPYGLTNNGGGPSARGVENPYSRAQAGASTAGFMGMRWDAGVPSVDLWAECLRVLKPGGHLLAFAGTRTQHRMATNIENAGFEIRDLMAWVYGSGFPKSRNIAEHDLAGADAERWAGWGTALKPALEPITMARKPLNGTVAANLLAHGTGAVNIGACRVPIDVEADTGQLRTMERGQREPGDGWGMSRTAADTAQVIRTEGRWPANLIHDGSDEVLAHFPMASGQKAAVSGDEPSDPLHFVYEGSAGDRAATAPRGDLGSAARFFYCPKASRTDRNSGLPDPGPQFKKGSTLRDAENLTGRKGNFHPTVKPTDLMAYLCRLVTPSGGVVLDPFMGSGSTGKACMREGFRFIGIDLDDDGQGNPLGYIEIARARIEHEARLVDEAANTPGPPAQSDLFAA